MENPTARGFISTSRKFIGISMNDAQQITEFRELHDRCDKLTQAVNTLTSAVSSHILKIRAYENIINDSWFLTRWLSQRKIEKEMTAINQIEGDLRNQEMRSRKRRFQEEEERLQNKADEQARNKLTTKREKQFLRLQKTGKEI